MTSLEKTADEPGQFVSGKSRPRLWLIVALCFAAIMPSNDSIWIDEAQTAAYANQPTFGAWLDRLTNDHFSEAQMPLGMAAAWLGGRILGTHEWQLRAANILWTAAAIWMVWLVGCRFRAPALAVVAAVQPFLWFYANEARPYSLQIAGGACLLLAAFAFVHQNGRGRSWAVLWSVSSVVLCASSLLAVIPVAVVSFWLALSLFRRRLLPDPRTLILMGGTVALLSLLGCYYLWTLHRGAGGATLWPVGLGNLAFSAYEILGFAGLGPARQALRDGSATGTIFVVLQPYLPLLGLFAIATLSIFCRSPRCFREREHRSLSILLFGLPIICTLVLFGLAKAVHFPFWGRHLAPLAPFLIVGFGVPALLSRHILGRIACALWLCLCLLSSLELRFAARHAKDDNRSAAAAAQAASAEGKIVWWAADKRSGEYYGLNFGAAPSARGVVLLPGMSAEAFDGQLQPDLIFTSKPETFDSAGTVSHYLTTHRYQPAYRFQAITGWVKS